MADGEPSSVSKDEVAQAAVVNEGVGDNNSTEDNKDEEKQEKDEWMDVLGNGAVMKKVLKPGNGVESRPHQSQTVCVSYVASLEDGTQVDKADRIELTLGDEEDIQGLDLVLLLMEMEEKCVCTIDPKFAYGELGREPDIPSNARLTYEIELHSTVKGQMYVDMTLDDLIALVERKKERGNYFHGRGEWSKAAQLYNRGLMILSVKRDNPDESQEDRDKYSEAKVRCQNNLAAAYLKADLYQQALETAESVLLLQPDNVKGLFRKAKSLAGLGERMAAIAELRKAYKIEPDNKMIHNELNRLKTLQAKEDKRESEMYKRMLGTNGKSKENNSVSKGIGWKLWAGSFISAALAIGAYASYRMSQS